MRRIAAWGLIAWAPLLGCASPKESTQTEVSQAKDVAGASENASAQTSPDPEDETAGAEAAAAAPKWEPRPEDVLTPHQAIEFPQALAYFYERLAQIDDPLRPAAEGAKEERQVIRVVNVGASMIGADDLTSVLRERFQHRFGDGGAGLVLMQRYMSNYLHRWVKLEGSGWEHCYISYLCKKDGHYGLGGTTFWSRGGASTTIATRKEELGDEVAHFEVWYAAMEGGGRLGVKIDGGERTIIDTRGDKLEDRYHTIDVAQGPHAIEVKALGHGNARTYGVVLETEGPGLVWDQFSMLGAFTKKVLAWDPEHIAGQVAQRDPDLIVFTYGGNDLRRVANGKLDRAGYVREYSQVVERVRAGKPQASCMIVGITDRGKSLTFTILPEHVETIVSGQREVAEKSGCAFFDTYTAMGGGGSLKAWKRENPPLAAPDLKHLNHRGRLLLGGWIYDAVVSGYVDHRKANQHG